MIIKISFFLILILFYSCNNSKYNIDTCEELSMKAYRGFPRQADKFKKNCLHFDIHYTGKLCQKALTQMIMRTPEKEMKKLFGEKIFQCFNNNDLEKFYNK